MINNRITRRTCRWGSGVGLAGGAFATAAMIGIGTAHADLLDATIANYTDANHALSQIDLSLHPELAEFISGQIGTQSNLITSIGIFQGAEEVISSHAGFFGFLVNGFFTVFNLGWFLDSEAVLHFAQAAESALADNLGGLAAIDNIALFALDLELYGDSLDSFVIDLISLGVHHTSTNASIAGDALAAALPAQATDPSLDPFLELVQTIDANAFSSTGAPVDIVGTIASQIDSNLASTVFHDELNTMASQILAGEFLASGPQAPDVDAFEDLVQAFVDPTAFTDCTALTGICAPADPNMWFEQLAYQLDTLLAPSVYGPELDTIADQIISAFTTTVF